MPYGLRRRRTTSRRVSPSRSQLSDKSRITRRSRRYASGPSPVRSLRAKWTDPIPQNASYKFRYVDNGFNSTLDVVSGYRTFHRFSGNSCYDPDSSGIGVQPYGWDEVCALFPTGVYRVCASSCTISFAIASASASQVKVYLIPSRDASPSYTDVSDLLMIPGCRSTRIDKSAGLTRQNYLESYCTTRWIRKSFNNADSSWGANVATNPASMWYWLVYFDCGDTAESVNITFDVSITYYTLMSRVDSMNES